MPDQIKIEPHEPTRESCLEPHVNVIAEMRKVGWPYRKILAHLEENEDLKVHYNALFSFCKVRKIEKGVGIKEEWKPRPTPEAAPPSSIDAMISEATGEARSRANRDPFKSPLKKNEI